jgi:hypothetical protein
MVRPRVPIPSSHQRAWPEVQPFQAAAIVSEAVSPIRFGFQFVIDAAMAVGERATIRPATRPAIGPPIEEPSHHTRATAPTPAAAKSSATTVGSRPLSHASGASR